MRPIIFLLWSYLFILPVLAQESEPIEVELTSGGLSITVIGDLDFGTHVLTGVEQVYSAQSAPEVEVVDARGTGAGWFVTVEASDFQSGSSTLSAGSLNYSATGGTWTRIHGQEITGVGPLETGMSGVLTAPLRVAEAGAGAGMGTYRWYPSAQSFSITIPGTARSGVYQSTLTFSITSGP